MGIKAKIDQINDEKKALFAGLMDRADAFKAAQREIMQDDIHTAQWKADRERELVERYRAESQGDEFTAAALSVAAFE